MKIEIEIENCAGCPYSWSHTNGQSGTSWVCDKLGDNVGDGQVIHEDCPLKGNRDD